MNHMDSELYNGVISGNHEVLKEVKGRPSVVNQLTPTNYTILHLASQFGNLGCVAEILSTHPSLLLKVNSRGETALHLAARAGQYGVAKALINAAKSSLLQLDHAQTTSATVVEFLIRTTNVEFDTALHEAVRYNHVNVVELLVTEDPSHPFAPNRNDETPLYMASYRGYYDVLKVILDNCVSPTYGGPQGKTALHAAILNEDYGGIKLLLEKKKDLIKVTDDYGWTSFHYAACSCHPSIIKDLIDADKSVAYLPDKRYKRIALHIAAYRGYTDMAKELLEHCPDSYDIVDGNDRNILHIAAERNQKEFIQYIVTNCKEVNNLFLQKDKKGNTPVHVMAISKCYFPEVFNHKQLDLEASNSENLTPLELAYSYNPKDHVVDQGMWTRALINGKFKWNGDLGRIMEEQGYENEKLLLTSIKKDKENMEEYDKRRNTQMIVAALIATVALTAGFAMPGGFDGNAGSKQGSPALLRKAAFKTFVVTDTFAVLCSLSSLFIYFMSLFYYDASQAFNLSIASFTLNVLSIIAMMLAFITGTYAVLAHSLALAIIVIVISSFFFPLVFYLFYISLLSIKAELPRVVPSFP